MGQEAEAMSDLVKRMRIAALRSTDEEAASMLGEGADDIEAREFSFDLRWNADMRAIKRWQAEKPGRELSWPDHADLCIWLLEQLADIDLLKADIRDSRAINDALREEIDRLRAQPQRAQDAPQRGGDDG
ncbi:hypothetical protein [Bradyrhizobium sp. S3.7.6]